MNRYIRLLTIILGIVLYLLGVRFLAPADEPYFLLSIAIVGLSAWLMGTVSGLLTALILIPANYWVYQQFSVSTNFTAFASAPAYIAIHILTAVSLGHVYRDKKAQREKEQELAETNLRLQTVLSNVQELGGLYNVCSQCKNIQDDDGHWQAVDKFLKMQTKMDFSHCICPDCADTYKNHPSTAD